MATDNETSLSLEQLMKLDFAIQFNDIGSVHCIEIEQGYYRHTMLLFRDAIHCQTHGYGEKMENFEIPYPRNGEYQELVHIGYIPFNFLVYVITEFAKKSRDLKV